MGGRALMDLSQLLLEQNQLPLAKKTADYAHKVSQQARDGDGVTKTVDLQKTIKNAFFKDEIKASVESNRHVVHYPVQPVLEFGLNKEIPALLGKVSKGL